MSYQTQAKIIAMIELAVCVVGLAVVLITGAMYASKKDSLAKDTAKLEKYPQLKEFVESPAADQAFYFLMPALYLVGELILAIIFYIGATQSKAGMLKVWLILTIIMSCVGIVVSAFCMIAIKEKAFPIAISAVSYIFTGYSLWVGYSLMQETK